jgi:hypothetical protein
MTAEELTGLVVAIHNDPDAARKKVEKAMNYVRERQTATMALVRRTLGL